MKYRSTDTLPAVESLAREEDPFTYLERLGFEIQFVDIVVMNASLSEDGPVLKDFILHF